MNNDGPLCCIIKCSETYCGFLTIVLMVISGFMLSLVLMQYAFLNVALFSLKSKTLGATGREVFRNSWEDPWWILKLLMLQFIEPGFETIGEVSKFENSEQLVGSSPYLCWSFSNKVFFFATFFSGLKSWTDCLVSAVSSGLTSYTKSYSLWGLPSVT